MINDLLKKLEFSDKEIEIYLAVLRNGKITHSDLSVLTKINRSTVYSIVNELLKKGVISQDLSQAKTYINALPPEDLIAVIKQEEKDLERKRGIIEEATKALKNALGDVKYSVPKIRFIGENELENFLYKQTPVWNDSLIKTEPSWLGFQDHTFVENYQAWIDWYWNSAPAEIVLKALTNKSVVEKQMKKQPYPNRMVKFFKNSHQFTATTWVVGDYLILIETRQHPFYAIEIRNTVLAENQREVFKALWDFVK